MNTTGIVILIVLIVLAAVAVALIMAAKQRRRREELQGRFGPEYDREVAARGGRRGAESHLADVADRRDKLEIRDLSPEQRQVFSRRWLDVQTEFVDHPARSVTEADALVGELMRERGYPVDDFDTKVDMVKVDHPEVAEHYRAAHAIASRGQQGNDGTASPDVGTDRTEDHRQAFVHYRALFAQLLDDGDEGRHAQQTDARTNQNVDLTEQGHPRRG